MKNIRTLTRRRFLQSAAATSVLSTPLAGAVRASSAANDRITLGLIGMGRINNSHLRTFTGFDDVQIVAACDCVGSRLDHYSAMIDDIYAKKKKSGTHKGVAKHRDFRELIARDDIDAVVIGTPDHWHAIPSIMACNAGKDVYCEKPLSLTIEEGRAMVNAARKNKRVFQTGSQQRSEFDGRFRLAAELVRNGRIGDLLTIHVGVGAPNRPCDLPTQPTPKDTDWDRWLGSAPWRGFNEILCPIGVHNHFPDWRLYREYAGGKLADMGAHHFDIAQWALGMDDSGPVEVIPPKDPNALSGLRFVYANGVEMVHGGPGGTTFTGTTGLIQVNRPELVTVPEEIAAEPVGEGEIRLENTGGAGGSHKRNWINCIRSRKKPIADVEIGHRTATICHLANIAYELRRNLNWDPKKEQFVGDAEANARISRERRGEWMLES